MDLGIEGKVVFITASTRGIGYATVESFLKEGAKVIINGRNSEAFCYIYNNLCLKYGSDNVFFVCGNMTEKSEIENAKKKIMERFGKIDILVPNLGSGKPIACNKLDLEEWHYMLDINLYSTVKLVDTFIDILKQQPQSSIVMVSSIAAYEKIGAPYAYAASKNAILTLTKYLAIDYAKEGIRVNAVVPGNIIFPTGRWAEILKGDEEGINAYIEQNVPMKRFGKPEEIADVIVFLTSDQASFITGNTVIIDGGQTKSY